MTGDLPPVKVELHFALSGKILASVSVPEDAEISILEDYACDALDLKHRGQICMCLGTQLLPREGALTKCLRKAHTPRVEDEACILSVEVIRRNGKIASVAYLENAQDYILENSVYLCEEDMRSLFPNYDSKRQFNVEAKKKRRAWSQFKNCSVDMCETDSQSLFPHFHSERQVNVDAKKKRRTRSRLEDYHIDVNGVCFKAEANDNVVPGTISMSKLQRQFLKMDVTSDIFLFPYDVASVPLIRRCIVALPKSVDSRLREKHDVVQKLRRLSGMVLNVGQPLVIQPYILKISCYVISLTSAEGSADYGLLSDQTWFDFEVCDYESI